jgi:hypothetical protein
MATALKFPSRLLATNARSIPQRRRARCFSTTRPSCTDGVYHELTAMRTRTPFIEALRQQQQESKLAPAASTNKTERHRDRDVSPKRMADSFHKVVCTSRGVGREGYSAV